ncbi:MAG: hypothetical protein GXP49_15070 [Deltaproteobacteria bacterium]|nr:hypothetical protein [Deltaproteobacteria bacterium]
MTDKRAESGKEESKIEKRNRLAQWAFDTQPILARLHLWLEDVDCKWLRGEPRIGEIGTISFLDARMERLMAMSAGVTALGTQLFGRYGEGAGLDKSGLNQVKKDADAISAYALAESLWFASRQLPENHAIMVSLGEGLMPKAGETPEMGSNPQLGFGRIYARPQVAQWLDQRVTRMLNDPEYGWEEWYREIKASGITVWGAAIDTLENTSRFAKGADTGAMTVLHLFDQPLGINRPYEGYMGALFLPKEVVEKAAARSLLVDYRTPRSKVMEAIKLTYPGIRPEDVHVWTLGGKSRLERIGSLWDEWRAVGAHLVEDGWELPGGGRAFTESGTYAPTYLVGPFERDNRTQLFITDGYAASAEAMQAASLGPMLGLDASLAVFTSRFKLDFRKELQVMQLDPGAQDFEVRLRELAGDDAGKLDAEAYRNAILDAHEAGLPVGKPVIGVNDFFPEKSWDVAALCGYMLPDPYSGAPGVQEVEKGLFRVTVRMATPRGDKLVTFTLRLMENMNQGRLIFNPLLIRFFYGEDFRRRAVTISDSGRIRNELQTLCSEAIDYTGNNRLRLHLERIPGEVISPEHQKLLREVLLWYKEQHPIWFKWLEIVEP